MISLITADRLEERAEVVSRNAPLPASIISLMQLADGGKISASCLRVAWLGIAALNCRRSSENTSCVTIVAAQQPPFAKITVAGVLV